jgi:hypothetical protein
MHRKESQQPQRIAYLLRSCPQALNPTAAATTRSAQSDATELHGERMTITLYYHPLVAQRRGRHRREYVKFYCKKMRGDADERHCSSEFNGRLFSSIRRHESTLDCGSSPVVEEHCYESARTARSTQR